MQDNDLNHKSKTKRSTKKTLKRRNFADFECNLNQNTVGGLERYYQVESEKLVNKAFVH